MTELPITAQRRMPMGRPAQGLGSLAIVGILVIMASLAAAVLRFSQQSTTANQQDLEGLRAASAARAGAEFGLYQALRAGWSGCASASQTLDLSADLGMHVTVSCNSKPYNEGESAPGTPVVVRIYSIEAVACNSSTCPDAVAVKRPGYVERKRQVQAVE